MSFLALIPPVLAGLFVLWAVGGFLSWSVGLRGFWAVAAAPAFATTLISGTAVVASWVGVPFSVLPVVVMTGIVGAAIVASRRMLRARAADVRPSAHDASSPGRRAATMTVVAVAVAVVVLSIRVMQIVQAPENISQTFDNIFHLNGVRYVLTENDASSLRLGYMTSPDGSLPFYPAAWHGLVALTVQISGASIPVSVTATTLIISAVIWPISAVGLVRTLFGPAARYSVAAALIAASLPGFPILLMDYGVLYPLQLSLALLPVALAATVRALGIVSGGPPFEWGWWVLILVGVLPGLTLAHPGGFVAWMVLSCPAVAVAVVRRARRSTTPAGRAGVVALAVAYVGVCILLLNILRPPEEARGWPLQMRMRDAVFQGATISMWYLLPAVVAALCVVAGIVWAFVDRTAPTIVALAMYLVGFGLFFTVASLPWADVRDLLTGSWYNNLPRLVAVFSVALLPLAAFGAARSWTAVGRVLDGRRAAPTLRPLLALAASAALLLGLQMDGAMNRAVEWASPLYRVDDSSPLLSSDEYALLERLPEEVPPGVAVAGSVWTGASLASALADRPVLMPHTLMQISEEVATINDGLRDAEPGDPVCQALEALDVGFVLDFGSREIHGGQHDFPGLDDLADSSAVKLVDEEGDARLYQVVACGRS
ncbi:hypothetical protein MTS1_03459 [Microbacterium sp. TS-1]|nr:hypothetical protein MTS1_03459 [Microbacterium sp. TS-1]